MKKIYINDIPIKILSYILKRFNKDFYFIHKHKKIIVDLILENERFNKLINNKIDTINNHYTNFYDKKYKQLIISNFISNINYLSKNSDNINSFIINNNISFDNYDISYNILIKVSLANVNSFNIILLFQTIEDYEKQYFKESNNIKKQTIKHFIYEYETMIEAYYNKKEAINTLIYN